MDKFLALLIFLVISYGFYNAQNKEKKHFPARVETCDTCQIETEKLHLLEKELLMIDTPQYIKQYIVDVIDHGSYTLGFSGGVMEGGFASHQDAGKIASYVVELSGKKCDIAYQSDAQMFYTSICGGCHGDDGKGLSGGNYPDLTREKLLGLKAREESLKSKIYKLKHQKHQY